jgi:hypothetical protein
MPTSRNDYSTPIGFSHCFWLVVAGARDLSVRCTLPRSLRRWQTRAQKPLHPRQFTTDDGLYSNVIDDLVQAHDGSLWVRENGNDPTRFDGQHFDASTKLGSVFMLNT